MPRKQRFKPSRKPKLADGTVPVSPVQRPTLVVAPVAADPAPDHPQDPPPDPPARPLRGRDAVIDD